MPTFENMSVVRRTALRGGYEGRGQGTGDRAEGHI